MRDILEIKDNFSLYKGIKSNLLWGNLNYCKSPKVSIIMPVFNHPDYFVYDWTKELSVEIY